MVTLLLWHSCLLTLFFSHYPQDLPAVLWLQLLCSDSPAAPELSSLGRKGFKNKGRGCAGHRQTGTLIGLLCIYDPLFLCLYSSIFPCSLLSRSPKPLPFPVLFSFTGHPTSPGSCLDLKAYSYLLHLSFKNLHQHIWYSIKLSIMCLILQLFTQILCYWQMGELFSFS